MSELTVVLQLSDVVRGCFLCLLSSWFEHSSWKCRNLALTVVLECFLEPKFSRKQQHQISQFSKEFQDSSRVVQITYNCAPPTTHHNMGAFLNQVSKLYTTLAFNKLLSLINRLTMLPKIEDYIPWIQCSLLVMLAIRLHSIMLYMSCADEAPLFNCL